MTKRTIDVDYLARVEGEGSLHIRLDGDRLEHVALEIFEPPRFFEALLQGRAYTEAPDITARICGICPVAYQMSTCHAMEDALGVRVDGQLRALRRMLYCGEWIESHTLHMVLLHAPDFLGYPDAVRMARDHPERVKGGLALKKAGNALMRMLGGREIHPINVRVGGFYKVPRRHELEAMRPDLEAALETAVDTVAWTSTLTFPELDVDYDLVSLTHADEYPFNEGRVAGRGLDLPVDRFQEVFEEVHEPHSTALHARRTDVDGDGHYLVGPLARYANNVDLLTPRAREAAADAGLGRRVTNPFESILVRGVEVVFALEEALRILDAYETPDVPYVEHEVHAGVGHAATEAPRGLLYHRYELDDDGKIAHATIVPPTSQNQARIEDDLRALIPDHLHRSDDDLRHVCEQAVRNHDPCISCSTHFLRLTVER